MSSDMVEALGITVGIFGGVAAVLTAARGFGILLRWFRWG